MVTDVDGTAKRAAAVLLQYVHNVTQKFLGYFPKVSANKCTDISPQEFLCVRCRHFSPSLPDKTAPREQWHTYGRALDRQKSGLGALLNSCSLCTHWASSQWWHNCLGNSQGKLLLTLQDSSSDLPYGRNGLVCPSRVWFVVWGKKFFFWEELSIQYHYCKSRNTNQLKKKKRVRILYMLMIKTINSDHRY